LRLIERFDDGKIESMKRGLLPIPVLIVLAMSVACCRRAPAAGGPPNIILILADDLRYDALGCTGNKILHTPNIDRLAARGTVFTNSFCTTAICPVSRTSIITGQYERRHKIADFSTPLSKKALDHTFPLLLRGHGYRTGFVGKWGLGDPLPADQYDFFRGFSGQGSYFPRGKFGVPGEHLTAKQAAQAVEFLEGCSERQPFLLEISTKAPHPQDNDLKRPFPPDPKTESLFLDVTIPKPPTATEGDFRALPPFLQTSEARARWMTRFSNDELYQRTVKDYYRLIVGVDELVGTVMEKLEDKHLAGNTVILFTSDNGFYLGDRGLAGKWFMHEESMRVPLVISDLRRHSSAPAHRSELVLNIDLAPTILDLVHVAAPPEMQGRSLVPLMEGESTPWRDEFFYEHRFRHPKIPMSEGIRTTRWKYIRYTSVQPVFEELFDLEHDPLEQHNLVNDPSAKNELDRLRSEWRRLAQTLQ
jgi:arylsulfatase A-like enzyme